MKLEEIYSYLPYNVMCDFKTVTDSDNFLSGTTFTRKLLIIDLHYLETKTPHAVYEYIKPHLRPLSDLTREIEHNGKKFVPIVELAKMLFHNTSNWGEFEYIGIDEAEQLYELQIQFKPKGIDIKPYTQYAIPMNPEKMSWKVIKKLHEWHFWLGDQSRFGKDIIDINTLNE